MKSLTRAASLNKGKTEEEHAGRIRYDRHCICTVFPYNNLAHRFPILSYAVVTFRPPAAAEVVRAASAVEVVPKHRHAV